MLVAILLLRSGQSIGWPRCNRYKKTYSHKYSSVKLQYFMQQLQYWMWRMTLACYIWAVWWYVIDDMCFYPNSGFPQPWQKMLQIMRGLLSLETKTGEKNSQIRRAYSSRQFQGGGQKLCRLALPLIVNTFQWHPNHGRQGRRDETKKAKGISIHSSWM